MLNSFGYSLVVSLVSLPHFRFRLVTIDDNDIISPTQ